MRNSCLFFPRLGLRIALLDHIGRTFISRSCRYVVLRQIFRIHKSSVSIGDPCTALETLVQPGTPLFKRSMRMNTTISEACYKQIVDNRQVCHYETSCSVRLSHARRCYATSSRATDDIIGYRKYRLGAQKRLTHNTIEQQRLMTLA